MGLHNFTFRFIFCELVKPDPKGIHYDSKKILQRMGYSGTSAVARLKDECVKLLHNLIGLAKVIEEGEKSRY